MRFKKIRGSKRRSRQIEKWRNSHLELDLTKVKNNRYNYVKIWVRPWYNLRYINRDYLGPKKNLRIQLLNALLDIYQSWENQLKSIGKPYYLKIWLFDPRFTSSQIVCAIENRVEYYNSLFYSDGGEKVFPTSKFSKAERIGQFDFQSYLDEEIFDDKDFPERKFYQSDGDYSFDQRNLNNLKNGKARIEEIISGDEKYNAYFVKKGNVWVGQKRQTDNLVS